MPAFFPSLTLVLKPWAVREVALYFVMAYVAVVQEVVPGFVVASVAAGRTFADPHFLVAIRSGRTCAADPLTK